MSGLHQRGGGAFGCYLMAFLALELVAARGLLRQHIPKVSPSKDARHSDGWNQRQPRMILAQYSHFPPSVHFVMNCFSLVIPHGGKTVTIFEFMRKGGGGFHRKQESSPKHVIWQLTGFCLDSSKPVYGPGKRKSGLWLPQSHRRAV